MTWSVAIYLTHLGYGGPEEGGWWYTYGELQGDGEAASFATEDEAYAHARQLQERCDRLNAGRPPRHSVSSNGFYEVEVLEGPARDWSNWRPYE